MQRTTFNIIGPRPSIDFMNKQAVRERLGKLGFLDPSVIIKSDNSVSISTNKNTYYISSNLELKIHKTTVSVNNITLPSENYGIQQILVNLEDSNDLPAFGEIDTYIVDGLNVIFENEQYDGKLTYVKYLTTKQG